MKAKAQTTQPAIAAKTFKWKITRTGKTQYLLYLPKGFDARDRKRWPLMLYLHGAGERGNNLQRVASHGPPSLVKQGREFPFIMVSPQCPDGQVWENAMLLKLLEHAAKSYTVDTNRVYLTGLSMGGYGTWRLAVAHPEKFAAIAPICGGGDTIAILLAAGARAVALQRLPVWTFHGANDPLVPLEESQRMVNALKKLGAREVKLTVYPEAEHNSWTETYSNPELYEWLLKHSR